MKYYNNKLNRKSNYTKLISIEFVLIMLSYIFLCATFFYIVSIIIPSHKQDIVVVTAYHTPPEQDPVPLKSIPEPCDDLDIIEVEQPEETTIIDIYTVQPGDSYWEISQSYYGDGRHYIEILECNSLNANDYIISGDKLLIPEVNTQEVKTTNSINPLFNNTDYMSAVEYNKQLSGLIINGVDQPEEYRYGIRVNPTIDINIPSDFNMRNHTEEVDTSNYEYAGEFRVTGYTPDCKHCCGKTDGIGASGVTMIYGYSVAAPTLFPLGTTIYVEGYGYYVVEDRSGSNSNTIDICSPDHESCYMLTNQSINVYIVSNN